MIRFSYTPTLDPRDLHKTFLEAGARPSMYSYKPCNDTWTLTMPDVEEGILVRQTLDRLAIDYDEIFVTSRFAE